MILTDLDEKEWEEIWRAPEGNEYSVQYKAVNEKKWNILEFALSKQTAMLSFAQTTSMASPGHEYRVVKLSRYPPCSVVAVIKYLREG